MTPEFILGNSLAVLFGFTICCMGSCGIIAGIAAAKDWQPARKLLRFGIALGFLDRFLIQILFGGNFMSPFGFVIDTWCILMMSLVAWRYAMATQLLHQYPWMYRRHLIFGWQRTRRYSGGIE